MFLLFIKSINELVSLWCMFSFDADFSLIENFINENNGGNFPF